MEINAAQIENMVSLLDGYVEKGGHHLNVNVFTKETLLDAQAHPEKYPQLTIRVSGYAVNFNKLTKAQQDEVISRTFHNAMQFSMECNGFIHSLESFGTVDGPGVRFVVFFQGCPMRCLFCHNPDTWTPKQGKSMTADEIIAEFERNGGFYAKGGITATGGEPMLQLPFLTELFKKAKERGIHTCLDTSGVTYTKENDAAYQELFKYTDLIMLDIKTSDPVMHMELTKQPLEHILEFAKATEKYSVSLRVRHVIVPGYTFNEDKLFHLGQTIGQFRNLKELEVLPYHSMGVVKYENLGMEYPLKGTKDLDKEDAKKARQMILDGVKDVRTR